MLVLNIITSTNLLLLFCLLFFRKNNVLPNKILALILINPAINFISNVNILLGNLSNLPYIYFFAQTTCFLFAPLVHMYVQLMTGRKINWKYPLYFITLGAMALNFYYTLEFTWMMPDAEKASFLYGLLHEPYPVQMVIINSLFILIQQIYFTITAIKVYRYRKFLSNQLSSYDKTKAVYITRFIELIWLLNIVTLVLYASLPMIQVEYIILPVVLTIICFFILYFSFQHNSIFTNASYQIFLTDNAPLQKDVVSTMKAMADPGASTDEGLKELAARVEQHLELRASYTNPELTLTALATEMNIPGNKISAAINKVLGKNFFELINEHRIRKSCELLQERKDLSIEGIAYEAGFNSRAAFYRAFRKHTGLTPSEYIGKTPSEG